MNVEGIFADLARNPHVRAAASAVFFDGVVPRMREATATARRAWRFPACALAQPHPCGATGVGICHVCRMPFCARHGLLLLGEMLDEHLQVALRQPTAGLCALCTNEGVKAAQKAHEASQGFSVGGFARTGYAPPVEPVSQSEGPQPVGPQPSWQGQEQPHYGPPWQGQEQPYYGYPGYPPPPAPSPPPGSAGPTLEMGWALVTLGLGRDATLLDVKRAYKALATQMHPDTPGGSHEAMTSLNRAKEILERTMRKGA